MRGRLDHAFYGIAAPAATAKHCPTVHLVALVRDLAASARRVAAEAVGYKRGQSESPLKRVQSKHRVVKCLKEKTPL